MKHLQIIVSGLVQGVFFRASTREKALELEITGSVCNQSDGTVVIHAEAEDDRLQNFLEWVHQGPEAAEVQEVQITEEPLQHFSDFRILR